MSIEVITMLMFGSLFFLLGLGLPVAFACGSVGVIFTAILQSPAAVNLVSTRIFGLMVQYLLAAIPLFIFMACILEKSGIIEELYELVYQWLGWLKGGVATATVLACTLLAAMVGVIGASEVTRCSKGGITSSLPAAPFWREERWASLFLQALC